MVDALNQVFTLFRLNYHNQYLKAFANQEELNEVKRLWLEMLKSFAPETILMAAKTVIETSEYLPTLRTMIEHCERAAPGVSLPDSHTAYLEACRAPSPKATYAWSHAAVYHAGQQCDWYFLQSSPESIAYPIFKEKYQEICKQVRTGTQLASPSLPALTEQAAEPLDRQTNQQKLNALRDALKL
jgi:Replication protein P